MRTAAHGSRHHISACGQDTGQCAPVHSSAGWRGGRGGRGCGAIQRFFEAERLGGGGHRLHVWRQARILEELACDTICTMI